MALDIKDVDKSWHLKILEHLFKFQSVWHVPLHENNFLKNTLGISDTDGNKGRKLVRKLDDLKENGLINFRISDHRNENVTINGDENDNTSITLNKYWFHAELTFKGIEYISNYLRLRGQQKIETQNKNILTVSIVIAGLTFIFIALTGISDLIELLNKLYSNKKEGTMINIRIQYPDTLYKNSQHSQMKDTFSITPTHKKLNTK